MTLVILAAGMGSRFGGLKQIEPVGPNGEYIIDYSIYDAIGAGFDRVVFIIKKENYDIFRETIGKRIEGKIKVDYVFQDNSHVPSEVSLPEDRIKPLGTADALLFCKDVVNDPFVIINADDFYGRDAYVKAAEFIKKNKNEKNYGLIAYLIGKTLTDNGIVKRGVCQTVGRKLTKLIESKCEKKFNAVLATPLDGSEPFYVPLDTTVSMNMFVFYPNLFKILETDLYNYLTSDNVDLATCELLIADVIYNHIKNNDVSCEVIENNSKWKGITYKEDLKELKDFINNEIERKVYPTDLY